MAAPTPPSSTPPPVRVTATQVKVMRIKDNVARLQFGGHTWNVSIKEHDLIAGTDKTLTLTDELADKVERHFQKLVEQGVFETAEGTKNVTAKQIVLEGRRIETPAAPVEIEIDTVKTGDAAGSLKPIDATIKARALPILTALGKTLADSDVELHMDPAKAAAASSSATATTPPAKKSTPPTPKVVERDVTIDTLQAEFKTRAATPITDPAAIIHSSFYHGSTTVKDSKSLQNAIADYVAGTRLARGHDYEKSPRFDSVLRELQHISRNPAAKGNLDSSAAKFTGGLLSYGDFKPGELDRLLLAKPTSLTDPEKKKLVQLYAQYLRDGHKAMGADFYDIFTTLSRDPSYARGQYRVDKQVVILEENKSGKIEIAHEFPKGEAISPANRIYLLKKGDSYYLYNATHTGLSDIRNITSIQTTTVKETVHHDVGGKGRCADRSLAHQLLVRDGNAKPSDAEITAKSAELRRAAAVRLKDPSFTARSTTAPENTLNTMKVIASLTDALDAGSLLSQKYASQLLQIRSSINDAATSIPNALVVDLTALPRSGIHGDIFDKLKGYIHDAYLADTDRSGGTSSTNPDFGYTTIVTAGIASNPDAKASVGYIRTALDRLMKDQENLTEGVRKLCEQTTPLSDAQAATLSKEYAAIIEQDPEAHLDQAFFAALAEVEDPTATQLPTAGQPKYQIAILIDNTGPDQATKPYVIADRYPGHTTPLDKQNALFIYYNGVDHYHSFQRKGESLDLATA